MKVTIVDTKSGKEKVMTEKFAKILVDLGRATYLTRDMQSQPVAARLLAANKVELPESEVTDELDSMDADELRAKAKELGLDLHHRTGEDKVRAAIREFQSGK